MQSTVYTVKTILDIPGKDRIKLMQLNETAYEFIVNIADGFKLGDKVVMILSDSLIPENKNTLRLKCYSFLKEKFYNKELNRIRTRVIKMAGIRSVGLIENINVVTNKKLQEIGTDLDSYFGIIKYEPDVFEATPSKKRSRIEKFKTFLYRKFPRLAKWLFRLSWFKVLKKSFPFPDHRIKRSDEENAENLVTSINLWADRPVVLTIKIEGCSMTCLRDEDNDNKLIVCSRNLAYDADEMKGKDARVDMYLLTAEKYRLKELIKKHYELTGHEIIIQGELCGPNIQKNIYRLTDYRFFIYRIKDEITGKLFNIDEVHNFVVEYNTKYGFHLDMVPIVARYNKLSDFLTSDNIENTAKWMEEHSCFEPFNGIEDIKFHFGVDCPKPDQKTRFMNEGLVLYLDQNSFKLKSLKYKEWFG